MTLGSIRTTIIRNTVFMALPPETRSPIEGGCQCPYCKANPSKTPSWDTLAINAKGSDRSWTVHFPELDKSFG